MRLSVICPVWNVAPNLLIRSVKSVLLETRVKEMILVDDCSTNPETIVAIAEIARTDARIKIIRNEINLGQSATRDIGIRAAAEDWIGFVDDDDIWLADKVQLALEILKSYPDAEWIGGHYISQYHDDSVEIPPSILTAISGDRLSPNLLKLCRPELTRALIGNSWFHLGAMLFKKSLLEKAGGLSRSIRYHEDYYLFAKLSIIADMYYIDKGCYIWCHRSGSHMGSPLRLSARYVEAYKLIYREKMFREFRKEARWALYAALKGLALNNLLSDRRLQGLRFSAEALFIDPREVGEFVQFLRLAMSSKPDPDRCNSYSRAQRFVLPSRLQKLAK